MLAFGIRYLNGFVAAAAPGSRDEPEWPPHPGRLFLALATAHFETGGDPAEREALMLLEGLPRAPAIRAGEHHARAWQSKLEERLTAGPGCRSAATAGSGHVGGMP